MLRTAGLLAFPRKTLSAGFSAGISTDAAAQLLGGWTPTETGLAPASLSQLEWTHKTNPTRSGVTFRCVRRELAIDFTKRTQSACGHRLYETKPMPGGPSDHGAEPPCFERHCACLRRHPEGAMCAGLA